MPGALDLRVGSKQNRKMATLWKGTPKDGKLYHSCKMATIMAVIKMHALAPSVSPSPAPACPQVPLHTA